MTDHEADPGLSLVLLRARWDRTEHFTGGAVANATKNNATRNATRIRAEIDPALAEAFDRKRAALGLSAVDAISLLIGKWVGMLVEPRRRGRPRKAHS